MAASATDLLPAKPLPRIGFVGLGWIGTHRLRALAESGCATVAALTDTDRARAADAVNAIGEWQQLAASAIYAAPARYLLAGYARRAREHAQRALQFENALESHCAEGAAA
jgi:prephenate dehydrogenase